MISAAAVYAVVCLLGTTSGTWAYALPVIFAAMAYLNVRLIIGGNTVAILRAVMFLIRFHEKNTEGIMAAAKRQEESSRAITQTAENIRQLSEQTKDAPQ